MKRILISLLFLSLATSAWGQAINSGDTSKIKQLNLDGHWKLTDFRAPGIFSGSAEIKANRLIGKKVLIKNTFVTFPEGEKCQIVSSENRVLKDGRRTFGSGGGSWKQIGLTQAPDGTYKVLEIKFDCDEKFWGLTIQKDLHLLSVWEVYLVMDKAN